MQDPSEYEKNLLAVQKGIPIVAPVATVQVNGTPALVEPLKPSLIELFDRAKAGNLQALQQCRRSFKDLVAKLQGLGVGGDFKLDNILMAEDGTWICTDLHPEEWSKWFTVRAKERLDPERFRERLRRMCDFDF